MSFIFREKLNIAEESQPSTEIITQGEGGLYEMEATSENGADITLENYTVTVSWEVDSDAGTTNLVVQCADGDGNDVPVNLIIEKKGEN